MDFVTKDADAISNMKQIGDDWYTATDTNMASEDAEAQERGVHPEQLDRYFAALSKFKLGRGPEPVPIDFSQPVVTRLNTSFKF